MVTLQRFGPLEPAQGCNKPDHVNVLKFFDPDEYLICGAVQIFYTSFSKCNFSGKFSSSQGKYDQNGLENFPKGVPPLFSPFSTFKCGYGT